MTSVSFTFFDIDNVTNPGWGDRVSLSPQPTSFTVPAGSFIIGIGKDENEDSNTKGPFRSSQPNTDFADTSTGGNVTVTYTGPISSFTILYENKVNTGGTNQHIAIGNITFRNCT